MSDKVLVRIVTSRTILEDREDADGFVDFYVIDGPRILAEREWFEDRAKALPAATPRTEEGE